MTSFPTPDGFEVPAGVEEGSTFDAMATLRLDAGGVLTLLSLEGHECGCGMSEEADDDEEEEEEGPEGGPHQGKSFVNQVEINFGSAGLA